MGLTGCVLLTEAVLCRHCPRNCCSASLVAFVYGLCLLRVHFLVNLAIVLAWRQTLLVDLGSQVIVLLFEFFDLAEDRALK